MTTTHNIKYHNTEHTEKCLLGRGDSEMDGWLIASVTGFRITWEMDGVDTHTSRCMHEDVSIEN